MDFTQIILKALSLEGIRNFFIVQDDDGSLSKSQIIGTLIQLVVFSIVAALIVIIILLT